MRPELSVTGTRCTRCTPLSNFSFSNTFLPEMRATLSLMPPSSVEPSSISSHFQPCGRVVLVHAQKFRAKEAGLVAARAGAHFKHGVFAVVRVLGQQGDARLVQRLAQFGLKFFHFLARHVRHVGVIEKLVRLVELLGQRAAISGDPVELGQGRCARA